MSVQEKPALFNSRFKGIYWYTTSQFPCYLSIYIVNLQFKFSAFCIKGGFFSKWTAAPLLTIEIADCCTLL